MAEVILYGSADALLRYQVPENGKPMRGLTTSKPVSTVTLPVAGRC